MRIGIGLKLLSSQEVDNIATPAVRGSGPREAVLSLTGSSVDFAPMLAEVRAGRYGVELRPWTASGPSAESASLEVVWRRPQALVSSGIPPTPGLYQLTLTDRAANTIGGALVLLVADTNYAAADRAFERAQGLSEKWVETVGEAAVRRFRIESLMALARDPGIAEGGR